MQLSKFNTSKVTDKVASLRLNNPVTGEEFADEVTGKPITIDLLSIDSTDHKKARHRVQSARIRKAVATGRQIPKVEDLEQDETDLLVACTKGWSGVSEDDAELAFTEENVRMVYANYNWVREQALAFVSNRANFLGN